MREYHGTPTRKKGEIKKFDHKKSRFTNIDFNTSNPVLTHIVIAVLTLIVLVYGIYQFMMLEKNKSPLTTQTALERTITKSISADGVVLRQESVLPSVASGTVVPEIPNGSKVSKGDTVASVFTSASDAANVLRLRDVEDEIAYYESIEALSFGTVYTDVETFRHNISKSLNAVTDIIDKNDLANLGEALQDLSLWKTRQQISTGTAVDVSSKLNALESLRLRYSGVYNKYRSVTAEESGYYVNVVDGFEGAFDYDSVLSISTEQVDALLHRSMHTSGAYVGKLITQFNWYYVCTIPESDSDKLKTGSAVTLRFPSLSDSELKMTLRAKNPDGAGNVTLVFSSNLMNAEIASLRLESASIMLESYTGYQVDISALRKVDGVDGVYVQDGNIVHFRKAKKIYAENDIILIGAEEGEPGYVRLYDEIILEGIDLYDGKIIN